MKKSIKLLDRQSLEKNYLRLQRVYGDIFGIKSVPYTQLTDTEKDTLIIKVNARERAKREGLKPKCCRVK